MENVKQNKMSEMPVGKLMLSMGIPMIISMVLQAVYNIVDSAFVSNMSEGGENALNALTLAFPLQILMVSVGIGTGVGANVLVARSLGMKDSERANKAAGNAAFLALVIYVIFLVFGLVGAEAYINSQTSNPEIAQMGTDYLRICCIFSFGMSFFAVYEKLLQSTGHSVCSTIAQISGAVTNIVLDPILIYGLFGFPELKVKGAAYATVIGQIVSFVVAIIFHLKVNTSIKNNLRYFNPDGNTIKSIYSIGLPAIISQALISVMTYGLNLIFGSVSETMVTAYGLYYKIQQFLLFAAFGMRDAIMPITAYAYGMNSRKRIRESVKFGQFLPIWAVVVVEFVFAYVLECLVGSPCSVKLASKVFNPRETHPVLFETAIICATVGIMCPAMSFIAAWLYYPYYEGFNFITLLANWLKLICTNFPFAFFSQLFFIQPLIRTLFKKIFRRNKAAEANH